MSTAYLPLDDRPCNTRFPFLLSRISKSDLLTAQNPSVFGKMFRQSDSAILSIDRWVYGGLVSSRRPLLTLPEAKKRLTALGRMLDQDAKVKKIDGISILLRQAPTAWTEKEAERAALISEASGLSGRKALLGAVLRRIPQGAWKAYLASRKRNLAINLAAIGLCKKKLIDFLAVGMDDYRGEGLNQKESEKLAQTIRAERLSNQISLLPGADELGMLLFARQFLKQHRLSPRIALFFSHPNPDRFQLRYEALPFTQLIASQVKLIGGKMVKPDTADLFLFVHTPQENQLDVSPFAEARFSYRWLKSLESLVIHDKPCVLADVRFANGADHALMQILTRLLPLSRLHGFSGWNTAANALGMALAQGVVRWGAERAHRFDEATHQRLLALRFLEDWLYQGRVRPAILAKLRARGMSTLQIPRSREPQMREQAAEALGKISEESLGKHFPGLQILDLRFPWHRLFDIDLDFTL